MPWTPVPTPAPGEPERRAGRPATPTGPLRHLQLSRSPTAMGRCHWRFGRDPTSVNHMRVANGAWRQTLPSRRSGLCGRDTGSRPLVAVARTASHSTRQPDGALRNRNHFGPSPRIPAPADGHWGPAAPNLPCALSSPFSASTLDAAVSFGQDAQGSAPTCILRFRTKTSPVWHTLWGNRPAPCPPK